ncbi:VIR protein [Plasmodium vivax]|uniref:VIR protein n=1 Tax=Plasmodium vivax TaxID=5855 RepID=A0A1G4E2X2_PLAVI|nr:VIR protein [Plasmodium vivax]
MTYPTIKYSEYAGITPNDYPLLKNLSFYEFYEELDKELSSSIDSESSCKLCEGYIASQSITGEELIDLCKKVCKIILNVNGILDKHKENTDDKPCQSMNYWLYANIMRISNNFTLFPGLYSILGIFIKKRNDNFKNCTFKNFDMDRNAFENKHILYEFSEIYDDMKNKIDTENELNTPLYCKHIKENILFYNTVKKYCTKENSCKYYDQLSNFKEKFTKSDELNIILDKCKYRKTSCHNEPYDINDVPCLGPQGNPILLQIFGHDSDNIVNILIKLVMLLVPISAVFLILFKFTPLGKSLKKLKQERKKNGRKKKKENLEDYMNNYAAYVDNVMKNRVNLGYHAT